MNDQEKSDPWLSPGLKSVLNVTLTVLCVSILFVVTVWFIQSMGSFLTYFSPVLWPLAIATILAILLRPVVRVMEGKFGLSHGLAIGLLYFLVIGVGAFSLWAVGGEVIQQTKELSGEIGRAHV